MLLFLLLSLFFTASFADCGAGVLSYNSICACPSAFTGDDCSTDNTGVCDLPAPAPLVTQAIGEVMIPSNITNNLVSLQIVSPGTQNRVVTSISFGPTPSDPAGQSNCTYPGPAFAHTFSGCNDLFTATIGVQDLLTACSFSLTPDPLSYIYTGDIRISLWEDLGTVRGHQFSRTVNSKLGFEVVLPMFLNVTANITAYSPPSAYFFVTYQAYDSESDTATILVTSILGAPYSLQTAWLFSTSTVFSIPPVTSTDCPSPTGDCIQNFTISIPNIVASGQCDFSGEYNFTVNSTCRGIAECPDPPEVSFSLDLTSEDLCTTYKVYSSLVGTLQSYFGGYSNSESIFIAGDNLYLSATLTSDVDISSITVQDLYVTVNSNNVAIVTEANTTTLGSANNFTAETQVNPQVLNFAFLLTVGSDTNDVIQTALTEYTISADITVTLSVVYRTSFSKRNIQTDQFDLKQTVFIRNKPAQALEDALQNNGARLSLSYIFLLPLILLIRLF